MLFLQFVFAAMDVIEVPHVVDHVARFLPSIRDSVSAAAVPDKVFLVAVIIHSFLVAVAVCCCHGWHTSTCSAA
jgi:hypothetical protein